MFQRLKGAIDSRIAEEQARQRQAQLSAQGRQPQRRRPQNQTAVAKSNTDGTTEALSTERGPDPGEFEPELVAGDEDGKTSGGAGDAPSSDNKEKEPATRKADESTSYQERATAKREPTETSAISSTDMTINAAESDRSIDLPADVRVKLRKLERLESKYGELLKAYRTAHARVQAVEPFEASLRENTPLTSIADPSALTEYLNQIKLKGDMVLDELKRVTTDRDAYKKKFEESEKEAEQKKTQIKDLQQKLEHSSLQESVDAESTKKISPHPAAKSPTSPNDDDDKAITKSRIPSLSLFPPKLGGKKEEATETSEDLFSYDSEIPKLEAELEEKTMQVEQLNRKVEALQKDLKVARESTEGMMQTLEERTKEVNILRDSSGSFEAERTKLEARITELETSSKTAQHHVEDLQGKLDILTAKQGAEAVNTDDSLKAQKTWEQKEKELQAQLQELRTQSEDAEHKLNQRETSISELEVSLAAAKRDGHDKIEQDASSTKKIKVMNGIMDDIRAQLDQSQVTIADLKKELKTQTTTFENKPSSRIFALMGEDGTTNSENIRTREDALQFLSGAFGLELKQSNVPDRLPQTASTGPANDAATGGNKKKNKKKKKGGAGANVESEPFDNGAPVKVSEDLSALQEKQEDVPNTPKSIISSLEKEISSLKSELDDKTAAIDRLSNKLKDQDALREEIEILRDDLLHQGEEHVEARDSLKKALEARTNLQATVSKLEKELAKLHEENSNKNASERNANEALTSQFEELKSQLTVMEKDLKAAEQLAAARFKDIADLKELLSKAQPELRSLRTEVAELKSAKEDLKNKQGEISRLESKHEDLKSEMKGLSRRLGDKDNDIKTLQQKVEQESRARSKVEDELTTAQSDLRVAENKKNEFKERADQTSRDLTRAKEDATSLRTKLRDIEDQVSNHVREIANLKEDVSLKGALHASSQSLVQSLRDQTHELSTQAREALGRTENLKEELIEAQKMLSDRTREGQIMRTLLNQTESGTDTKLRDMKETMEAAVEERDRIEDEANVSSRRMMKEVEDAKIKARDAQRQMQILENERDELEIRSRSWQRMKDDLEQSVESTKLEVQDVRTAMKELKEALDESERQIKEAESHKQDLRKQSEDANDRIEKLTKANKSLSEEIKALQSGAARKASLRPAGPVDSGLQSSRTSMDSGGARSPAPLNRNGSKNGTLASSGITGASVGLSQAPVDYVYLKNVLLQFLERKDKTHQRQLIPVLGMLLHFNRDDEQKFISAISAK